MTTPAPTQPEKNEIKMNLKEKIENNLVIWMFSILLTGFLSGLGTYQTLLEITGKEAVLKELYIQKEIVDTNYIKKEDCKKLIKDCQITETRYNNLKELIDKTYVKKEDYEQCVQDYRKYAEAYSTLRQATDNDNQNYIKERLADLDRERRRLSDDISRYHAYYSDSTNAALSKSIDGIDILIKDLQKQLTP